MHSHVSPRRSSRYHHRAREPRAERTRLVILLKHSLRLLKFGRRERQSRILVLAHLFQTFRVLSHLFQQVLLFLIVRIRALFKLLEARSILLRFQPLRCPSSSVNLETRASPPSLARTRPTREKYSHDSHRARHRHRRRLRASHRETRARARASSNRPTRELARAPPPRLVHRSIPSSCDSTRARNFFLSFRPRVDSRSASRRARSASRCAGRACVTFSSPARSTERGARVDAVAMSQRERAARRRRERTARAKGANRPRS